MAKQKVKPDWAHVTDTYLYSQRKVCEALGVVIKEGEIVRVYCDGDNKVRVEVIR